MIRVSTNTQVIGILYNFIHKNKVYFYQSGFQYSDDNRLKPGLVTHFLAINLCLEQGLSEYDFLAGDSRYKASLTQDSRKLHWVTIKQNNLKMLSIDVLRIIKRYKNKFLNG